MNTCKENLICYYYSKKKMTMKQICEKLNVSKKKTRKVLIDNNIKIVSDVDLEEKTKLGFHLYHRLNFSIKEASFLSKISIHYLKDYCKEKSVMIRHASFSKLSNKQKIVFKDIWKDERIYTKRKNFIIPTHLKTIICDKMGDMIIDYFEQDIYPTKMHKLNLIPTSTVTITDFLKINNIKLKENGYYIRAQIQNEDYFEVIDTEHKAYWLGFIMGDGCVSNNKTLSIGLKNSDVDILEKFKADIGYQGNIYEYEIKNKYKACSMSITSKKIFNDLGKYGVVPNKTYTMTFPFDEVPKKYYFHVLRGIFDADGSLPKSNNKVMGMSICGTKELIEDICVILKAQKSHVYIREDLVNFSELRCHKRQETLRMLNLIYSNANIYMKRKYERFLEFKEYHNITN